MKRVELKNISKDFKTNSLINNSAIGLLRKIFHKEIIKNQYRVLDQISLEVKEGEIIGLIGSNGCGKSTLLRIIAGIYPRFKGRLITKGNIVSLIGLDIGLIGRLTARDNIFLVGALFGLNSKKIKKRFNSILQYAELENYTDEKLFKFSSGMRQRLAFSIAIHANPEILLLDEVFSVGDEKFRKKSTETILDLAKKGSSVILVSHELDIVEKYCTRTIWIKNGIVHKDGNTKEVLIEYKKEN